MGSRTTGAILALQEHSSPDNLACHAQILVKLVRVPQFVSLVRLGMAFKAANVLPVPLERI